MYHIHCLNKISPKGTALLTDNYAITDDRNQADGVLVRSADMHNVALPESLLAVAAPVPASTTFPCPTAPKLASWCSTPPAPTPIP